jgi:Bacterial capsule synthesis protein PGA_cap
MGRSQRSANTPPRPTHRQVYRRRRIAALFGLGGLVACVGAATFAVGRDDGARPRASAEVSTTSTTSTPEQTTPATTPSVPAAPRKDAARVRFVAVGDIVMGSPPYGLPPDGGASFFRSVDNLFAGDVVMGNLEGTLASGGSSKCGAGSGPNCFAFRTPPSYAKWLSRAGFTLMNVANNHAFDFGPQGQRETLAALRRHGLRHTGRPGQITIQTVKGVRVAAVGFAAYKWAASLTDIPAAKALVAKAASQADIVVVAMHAGAEGSDATHVRPGNETYLGEPRGNSVAFTHAVIDAGADLVWSSGPHVLRGMEFHRGRLIAYSLGNFAGYKVFSLGGTLSTSAVLQVTLTGDGAFVSGRIRPTQIVKPGLPSPGGGAISLIAGLSRADFGLRGAKIGANGSITRRKA